MSQRWFEHYEYQIYEPMRDDSPLSNMIIVDYKGPFHNLSYFHKDRAREVQKLLNFLLKVGIDVPHM